MPDFKCQVFNLVYRLGNNDVTLASFPGGIDRCAGGKLCIAGNLLDSCAHLMHRRSDLIRFDFLTLNTSACLFGHGRQLFCSACDLHDAVLETADQAP